MNTQRLVAALAFVAASGTAFAQQSEFIDWADLPASTQTRAQVTAELEQSKIDGSYALAHQEFQGQFPALSRQAETAVAGKSRAQVAAELARSKADGSYAVAHQEFPGQFPVEELRYAQSRQSGVELAGLPQGVTTR